MGPQIFPSTLGFTTQTGPSPLQVLLASPVAFVPETVQIGAARDGSNEAERSAKRRKVMTLAEYRAMRSRRSYYVNTSPPRPEREDDRVRKLPTPQPIYRDRAKVSSSEESTPEPAIQGVPEVIDATEPKAAERPTGDQERPEAGIPEKESGITESGTTSGEVSLDPIATVQPAPETSAEIKEPTLPEVSRKRKSVSPEEEDPSPVKKSKSTVELASLAKTISSPQTVKNESKVVNGVLAISTIAKITKPAAGVSSRDTQTIGGPLGVKPIQHETKSVNRDTGPVPNEFPEKLHSCTAKGIANRGLWCYRNSIIQALMHVPAMHGYFSKHNQSGGDKCPSPGAGCICCLLREFTNAHFSDENGTNKKQRALELIDKLLGGDFAKVGLRHEQQDADEYAIRMLDKAVEQQKKRMKEGKTALEQLLEIMTSQDVICNNKNCKHRSQTKSYNTSVRAKMTGRNQNAVHLKDLVNDLEVAETIKDFKCEKCGKLGAKIKRRFTELPPALMVHVNRGGKTNLRGQAIKLNNWLKFEPEMLLKTSDGVSHKYVLRSVVSHIGPTLNSGHYVCFGRNPNRKTWSMCDDHIVSQTSEAKFRGGKEGKPKFSAYILMYGKA